MLQVIFTLFYMYIRLEILLLLVTSATCLQLLQISQTHSLLCYGLIPTALLMESFDILDPVILSVVLLSPSVMVVFRLAVPLPVTCKDFKINILHSYIDLKPCIAT